MLNDANFGLISSAAGEQDAQGRKQEAGALQHQG
jgi:hypothetical protein